VELLADRSRGYFWPAMGALLALGLLAGSHALKVV
jgi:hypothetical protein